MQASSGNHYNIDAVIPEDDVKENVLFLSILATLGKELSSNIIEWFKKFNIVSAIHDFGYNFYTIEKLKTDKQFFNWVSLFLKYLEIANLSTIEEDISTKQNEDKNDNKKTQAKKNRIVSYHRKYDENNILVDKNALLQENSEYLDNEDGDSD